MHGQPEAAVNTTRAAVEDELQFLCSSVAADSSNTVSTSCEASFLRAAMPRLQGITTDAGLQSFRIVLAGSNPS